MRANSKRLLPIAAATLLVAAALVGCTMHSMSAESTQYKLTVSGERAFDSDVYELYMNSDCTLEVAPDMEDGYFEISITNGLSTTYGNYKLDANNGKHRLVEVDEGRIIVKVHAEDATGLFTVQPVEVLDGPGTPGS